jgi:hypothetical protein
LKFWQPNRDIRHAFGNNNLASQTRIVSAIWPQPQHSGFLAIGRRQIARNLNKTMARAANSTPAAICVDTGDIVL